MFEDLKSKVMGAMASIGGLIKKKKKKDEDEEPEQKSGAQPDAFHLPTRMGQISDRRKLMKSYSD